MHTDRKVFHSEQALQPHRFLLSTSAFVRRSRRSLRQRTHCQALAIEQHYPRRYRTFGGGGHALICCDSPRAREDSRYRRCPLLSSSFGCDHFVTVAAHSSQNCHRTVPDFSPIVILLRERTLS